jgi:hypothetical protein
LDMENPSSTTATLDQIETFLREMITSLTPTSTEPQGPGRPYILPALCLWAGVVVCVLRGWSHQLAVWRLLRTKGLWEYPRFPVSDQAIYKRLAAIGGGACLQQLFHQVSELLQERLAPYRQPLASFASQVVAIDATTLDTIMRHLPALRAVEDAQLLAGKLAGVLDLRLQQWCFVMHLPEARDNEKTACQELLAHIQPGALILMDLGFFSFPWFDQLTAEGYFWISRLRQKTSYQVVHVFFQEGDTFDGLIWLGSYRADQARYAVRLVGFRVGEVYYQYISNVLSPVQLSLAEVAQLYARRWDIEMAFKLIKRELGLHLLWSAKPELILEQIWAVLLISQILHALQLEIAAKAGVDPFDVSLSLLVTYLPRWPEVDFMALVVERGRETGFIRPSRRIHIHTPPIDRKAYRPIPPELILVREPRYAHRRATRE